MTSRKHILYKNREKLMKNFFLVGYSRNKEVIISEFFIDTFGWKQRSVNGNYVNYDYVSNETIDELKSWFEIDFQVFRICKTKEDMLFYSDKYKKLNC